MPIQDSIPSAKPQDVIKVPQDTVQDNLKKIQDTINKNNQDTKNQIDQLRDTIPNQIKGQICEQSQPDGCIGQALDRAVQASKNQPGGWREALDDFTNQLQKTENTPGPIKIPVVNCVQQSDGTWKSVKSIKTVLVAVNMADAFLAEAEAIAKIAEQTCECRCQSSSAYAVVPESWELRPEAQRPQLIIVFKEKLANGTIGTSPYPLTIPHPIPDKPKSCPIPDYQKGQWEGILVLKDNSKVIVNAISLEEADRILTVIKGIIYPAYLKGSYQKVGQRKGQALKTINVIGKNAFYFSQGIKNARQPDWMVTF